MEISLPDGQAEFIARKLREGRYLDAGDVIREALRRLEQQDLANLDIEAEAFIVLLEASRSAQEDLRVIMAEVRAINAAKQAQRQLIDQINRDAVVNAVTTDRNRPLDFSTGLGSETAYHSVRWPVPDVDAPGRVTYVNVDLWPRRITTGEELRAILDRLRSDLDRLGDLGELDSLRLQMALDRRSKLIEALSNVEKKLSDTSAAVIQNLK